MQKVVLPLFEPVESIGFPMLVYPRTVLDYRIDENLILPRTSRKLRTWNDNSFLCTSSFNLKQDKSRSTSLSLGILVAAQYLRAEDPLALKI